MKKLICLLVSFILLSGCSTDLSFIQIDEKKVSQEIQSFVNNVRNENGIHLYFDKGKNSYIYLNGGNVKSGEKAVHFTDFEVTENGNTLDVLYSTDYTNDHSNESLKFERLYKVNLNKKYEHINLYENGEEVSFGTISGN